VDLMRASAGLGAVALVLLFAAGCRGGSSSSAPADETLGDITPAATATAGNATQPTPIASTAAACTPARPHASGDSNETLDAGGARRTYILHVPPSYDGSRALPLVLNFHGFGSNARDQAIYSQLPAKADDEGFIVITPDGTGTPRQWTYPGLGATDDIGFVGALLDRIESQLCVDSRRVFAAGMSNGAAFSSFVACAMPDRITAIAAIAATAYPVSCMTARAIPVISFRGTDDACVPFAGGTAQCGQHLPVRSAEDSARAWAAHDNCKLDPARQPYSEHVRTVAYSECRDDAAVVLFIVDGGGHTWPGSIGVPRLGVTTHEVNATDQLWEFFVAQGALRR
jgi:polyhydroxybutyrate depolymerase